MLSRSQNDELNLLVVRAKAGDMISREALAERLYPVAMVIAKRFFEEYSTEYLTRRELAQECCMAFFDRGIQNYQPVRGDVMAYFAGLCVWVGCKARQAAAAGRRGGLIKGLPCHMIRVDAMGVDRKHGNLDGWELLGIRVLDRGQARVDAADEASAVEARGGGTAAQWRAMRLVYEKGLSYREAGEFLGLSARQVDAMLMKLRAVLEEGTP